MAGLTVGPQSCGSASAREYAGKTRTGNGTATTTWLSSNPPSLWQLVRCHGCGVQISSVTNWKVRPLRHKSTRNQRRYEWKCDRQDHQRVIIVARISHASMRLYPAATAIHSSESRSCCHTTARGAFRSPVGWQQEIPLLFFGGNSAKFCSVPSGSHGANQ